MATITLPIKCSTVRKADSVLNRIIDAEEKIGAILFVIWSVTLFYRVAVARYSFYPDYDVAAIQMTGSAIGCLALAFVAIVNDVPEKIYAALPSLTCIKDEEDTS